jgi:hypothetical protein
VSIEVFESAMEVGILDCAERTVEGYFERLTDACADRSGKRSMYRDLGLEAVIEFRILGRAKVEPGCAHRFEPHKRFLGYEAIPDGCKDMGIDALPIGASVAYLLFQRPRVGNCMFADDSQEASCGYFFAFLAG